MVNSVRIVPSEDGYTVEAGPETEDKQFSLDQLREGIGGGWIELIPLHGSVKLDADELSVELVKEGRVPNDTVVIADEEGRLKKQLVNEFASQLCGVLIVGVAMLTRKDAV